MNHFFCMATSAHIESHPRSPAVHSWADLVVVALCALVVFALKTELFFYMFESVEVFYLRMKLLRRFNQVILIRISAIFSLIV
jgi:hypothetical protein